jgi:hypothetical protein
MSSAPGDIRSRAALLKRGRLPPEAATRRGESRLKDNEPYWRAERFSAHAAYVTIDCRLRHTQRFQPFPFAGQSKIAAFVRIRMTMCEMVLESPPANHACLSGGKSVAGQEGHGIARGGTGCEGAVPGLFLYQ